MGFTTYSEFLNNRTDACDRSRLESQHGVLALQMPLEMYRLDTTVYTDVERSQLLSVSIELVVVELRELL
jgi:hypothetical protein